MKTNKSYTKRLKVTKNGKIKMRAAGQNHYNARESNRKQVAKRRALAFVMKNKDKSRFLAQSSI